MARRRAVTLAQLTASGGSMDVKGLRSFLKKEGRAETALDRGVAHVSGFEQYLAKTAVKRLDDAQPRDIESFVAGVLREEKKGAAKTYL
jgi:hypothetical protein